jgi:hypothetical protein
MNIEILLLKSLYINELKNRKFTKIKKKPD